MTDTTQSSKSSQNPTCQTCNNGSVLSARGQCCRDFRGTLGRFATGVTVITALSHKGEAVGVTVSSFNTVSLDPPLILWSLSTHSPRLETFKRASHYAINVLSAEQRTLSDRFASRTENHFSGLITRPGLGGVPLLEGCCGWFECVNEIQYPGGDHVIFVGHVERFAQGESVAPLVFFNGAYRLLDGRIPD